MRKSDKNKTLWELDPELKVKLDKAKALVRELGLMDKFEFS
jgi:hypothetical protein